MANHKKLPIFLRIKSSQNQVICINPQHIASFQIAEKAQLKNQKTGEVMEADTIRFYTSVGTTFVYSVGVDITQEEFGYICATLLEYLYLNEHEFRAKTEQIESAKMAEWNAIMASEAEEAAEIAAMTQVPKAEA